MYKTLTEFVESSRFKTMPSAWQDAATAGANQLPMVDLLYGNAKLVRRRRSELQDAGIEFWLARAIAVVEAYEKVQGHET